MEDKIIVGEEETVKMNRGLDLESGILRLSHSFVTD